MRELSFPAPLWTEGVDILADFRVCVCVWGERAYILAGSSLYRWSSSRWINHKKFLPLSKLALLRERTMHPPLRPPLQPSTPSLSSLPLPLVNPSNASSPSPYTTPPHWQSQEESRAGPASGVWIGLITFPGSSCTRCARLEQSNGKLLADRMALSSPLLSFSSLLPFL